MRIFLLTSLLFGSAGMAWADVFSNVPEAVDYHIAYELDIPLNGAFQGPTPVPYAVNHSATVAPGGFDRVAYYLELTNTAGATTWCYASMDAFTSAVSQTGLPHAVDNPVSFQRSVSNLTVISNLAGVKSGSFDQGWIEMWHRTYTAADASSVFAASATTHDWGDTIGTVDSGYGSFQIHNPGVKQVVLAYNRWATGGATNDDVGIGSSPGANPDWTQSGNTSAYTSRRLVVLVRPLRFNVAFTAVPVNRQVTPRNVATNLATVAFAGSETTGGFAKALLKVSRNGVPYGTDLQQDLNYVGGSANFTLTPAIPAELASYSFEFYLQQGENLYLVRKVSDVTAGDVYLWYGQSNGQSDLYNGSSDAYLSPWIRTFGISSDSATITQAYNFWVEADGDVSLGFPCGIGQWPLVVGRKIVDAVGIPVAILNGARNGYDITQLQRDDASPDNLANSGTTYRVYNRLRYRAIQAKVAGGVRGIFFYQGESDSNNAGQHISGFASLMADWQVDYPALERVFVSQVHVGCRVDRLLPELRNAQRLFEDVYQPVRVMSTNGLTTHTDNCHFPFAGGYETHGLNTFRQVRRELYGASDSPAIDPPNPDRVEFSASNKIRIILRKSDAGVTVDAGSLADFRLNGSSASLLSATVTNNAIELNYNGSVATATSLDYLAHVGSAGGWVRNSNGIGLLTFSEPITGEPIIVDDPEITLISPTELTELPPGSEFSLSASATSPVTAITRMEIFIDGILHTAANSAGTITTNWTVPASGAHSILFRATNAAARTVGKSVMIRAGVTTAPGGVSSGLNVWLRPESGIIRNSFGVVSEWQDSSGKNNGCVQATASARPAYLAESFGPMPGVAFDGDDFLVATAGMSTGSYTKIVRIRLSDLNQPGNMISSGAASGVARHALFMSSTALPRLWHNTSFAISTAAMTANQSHILVGTYDSTTKTGTVHLDGVQVASGTTANNNVDLSYQLGAIAGGNFLRGSIGEAIIYNRALNGTERASVEDYLNAKTIAPPAALRVSYADWSAANIDPPADASANGDANDNGIDNLIEFALGLDPTLPGTRAALEVGYAAGTVELSYRRPTDRTGITYQLLESPDLLTWIPVADTAGPTTAGLEVRRYSRTIGPDERKFYQLRVTLAE